MNIVGPRPEQPTIFATARTGSRATPSASARGRASPGWRRSTTIRRLPGRRPHQGAVDIEYIQAPSLRRHQDHAEDAAGGGVQEGGLVAYLRRRLPSCRTRCPRSQLAALSAHLAGLSFAIVFGQPDIWPGTGGTTRRPDTACCLLPWRSGLPGGAACARRSRRPLGALSPGAVLLRALSGLAAELFTMRMSLVLALRPGGLRLGLRQCSLVASRLLLRCRYRSRKSSRRPGPPAAVQGLRVGSGIAGDAARPGAPGRQRDLAPRAGALRHRGVQRPALAHRTAGARGPGRWSLARPPVGRVLLVARRFRWPWA